MCDGLSVEDQAVLFAVAISQSIAGTVNLGSSILHHDVNIV